MSTIPNPHSVYIYTYIHKISLFGEFLKNSRGSYPFSKKIFSSSLSRNFTFCSARGHIITSSGRSPWAFSFYISSTRAALLFFALQAERKHSKSREKTAATERFWICLISCSPSCAVCRGAHTQRRRGKKEKRHTQIIRQQNSTERESCMFCRVYNKSILLLYSRGVCVF